MKRIQSAFIEKYRSNLGRGEVITPSIATNVGSLLRGRTRFSPYKQEDVVEFITQLIDQLDEQSRSLHVPLTAYPFTMFDGGHIVSEATN